jgi:hypothetical protein
MALILDNIQSWIDLGWRLGNYCDAYEVSDAHGEQSNDTELAVENGFGSDGWDEIERLPALNPRQRPEEFNQMLRALARTMAELHNNLATAYAVFKTGQFFSEEELDDGESEDISRFLAAIDEFQ